MNKFLPFIVLSTTLLSILILLSDRTTPPTRVNNSTLGNITPVLIDAHKTDIKTGTNTGTNTNMGLGTEIPVRSFIKAKISVHTAPFTQSTVTNAVSSDAAN